ncbi:maltokinase N-terminal cap-like domain-containing protein [Segeticoccus rhizosphaerae]|jgi:trehalose synthase-fused probable maltokinase|uniref:maltokinase N-terminal cap-like domain-containing protein n=1 Tax=Segeticoccus rhizosphaerae TaxID=1104777 RepID=UPI0012654CBD
MAEVHHHATLTPTKLELLPDWMARQRWYAAKGHQPRLRSLWSWRLDDPSGAVGIEILVVADDSGTRPVVYQVPLTYRGAPLEGADHALVGTLQHSVLGRRWVYDAPHDPVFTTQLLELVLGRVTAQAGSVSDTPEPAVVARCAAVAPDLRVLDSHVLSGEQSNTSVIYDAVDTAGAPRPVIGKLFRVLHCGENPDVVLQTALAEAGCDRVPTPVGDVSAAWPDESVAGGTARGHVAFVQEFLPGVQDAWREALAAAHEDRDFSAGARALGRATAEVHQVLATVLPTEAPTPQQKSELVERMRARLRDAIASVPSLAGAADAVDDLYVAAERADWPVLQRIHGDYHLGQVLDAPGRGWVLLDFEGEPMRPLAERSEPDVALRDVAGMLRSLDYAAGSVAKDNGLDRARWATAARTAFLEGYGESAGRDPRADAPVLDALELDKALYEVVYEAHNRPSWISIPTTAIARLVAGSRS